MSSPTENILNTNSFYYFSDLKKNFPVPNFLCIPLTIYFNTKFVVLLFLIRKFCFNTKICVSYFFRFKKFSPTPNSLFYFNDTENFFPYQIFYVTFPTSKTISYTKFLHLSLQIKKFSAITNFLYYFSKFYNFFLYQIFFICLSKSESFSNNTFFILLFRLKNFPTQNFLHYFPNSKILSNISFCTYISSNRKTFSIAKFCVYMSFQI